GLVSGPCACSSRSLARPSQNCACENSRLITVGLLRAPSWKPTPGEVRSGSAKPWYGLWQLAHEIERSFDRRASKYSSLPSSILSALIGLSAGMYASLACRPSGSSIDQLPDFTTSAAGAAAAAAAGAAGAAVAAAGAAA